MDDRSRHGDLVAFFRRYTRTWVHALATAALTLFGTLTFVHPWFAAVAVASYVLPPVALYARGIQLGTTGPHGDPASSTDRQASTDTAAADRSHDAPGDDAATGWTAVDAPTSATLFDVALTGAGAYAVGEEGVVLAADDGGWQVALTDGPGTSGRDLRGVDAVGSALWVAGDGGALGRVDASSGRHVDYSAPAGHTDTWTDVAVAGTVGDETVLLGNGSGAVLRGRYRDGDLVWEDPVKPGSGSSLAAVSLVDAAVGYLCDTNDAVFETVDGGASYETVGVDGADGTATDVAAGARGTAAVAFDDGTVRTYADGAWTPTRVTDAALPSLALQGGRLLACSRDGAVHERPAPGADWTRRVVASGALLGAATGADRSVAVGTDGTVVERRSDAS